MSIRKLAIVLTGFSFFCMSCSAQKMLPAQEKLPRIENVTFKKEANTVNVYYDLFAESDKSKFNVELLLSLGGNQSYQVDTTSASGDIGPGVLPGKQREIIWNVQEDFPQGIQNHQIQFIVDAEKTDSPRSKSWIYITSGALILSAGAVLGYFFLEPGGKGLPAPPSRPAGH